MRRSARVCQLVVFSLGYSPALRPYDHSLSPALGEDAVCRCSDYCMFTVVDPIDS